MMVISGSGHQPTTKAAFHGAAGHLWCKLFDLEV